MCIEVATDDGTRILLDLGMPLTAPNGGDFPRDTPQRPTADLIAEGVLRDVPGVFPHDPTAPAVAAIILTHSHLDHYGLAHHAHPAIPVYGSEGTIAVLEVGRVFFPDAALPADLRRLPVDETLRFGDLSVTAIPVDHAAPDSRALLIEADGRRLEIYFGTQTGEMRSFMERLLFAPLVYSEPPRSAFPRKIRAGVIYTMNAPEEASVALGYGALFRSAEASLRRIFGEAETFCCYDTYQFPDYSKVVMERMDPAKKSERREKVFPDDCRKTFEFGCRIALQRHSPDAREIDGETMIRARVVDSHEANLAECGNCLMPIAEGLLGPEEVSDEIGEVLAGAKPGCTSTDQLTVYQSCVGPHCAALPQSADAADESEPGTLQTTRCGRDQRTRRFADGPHAHPHRGGRRRDDG